MSALSRRAILKAGMGLGAALPLLSSRMARAADPVFPKRLLVFFHPNGVLPSDWFPTAGTTEQNFTFSPSLSPLAPWKQHVMITKGIDYKSLAPGPGEPHQRGMGGMLTGWHLNPGNFVGGDGSTAGWSMGQSIDHKIASVIGATTRFGQMQLGIKGGGGEVRHHLSYGGPGLPLPVRSDPKAVFDDLFQGFTTSPTELQKIRARRASILDAVKGQLAAVAGGLPAGERVALDQHLTLVRDLENRLYAEPTLGDSCQVPAAPQQMDFNSDANVPALTKNQIDLMVMAFACDLMRVGTIQFSQAQNYMTKPWLGQTYDGHSLSHLGNSDPNKPQVAATDKWLAEQFAYLLGKLAMITEGSGTMLDNTLIIWGNEIGEGNSHSHVNIPFVFAGHAAGWRMGRYVQWQGASHNNMLVSILHGFGVMEPKWGNPDFCSGELSNLL